jgi:hypothetical protein
MCNFNFSKRNISTSSAIAIEKPFKVAINQDPSKANEINCLLISVVIAAVFLWANG